MKNKKSIKVSISLLLLMLLSCNVYSQYGVIEMKNGEHIEMADEHLFAEGDSLRYFIKKYNPKSSVMGIGMKKLKKDFLAKSRQVKIDDIYKIHVKGELLAGKKTLLKFKGIRYTKVKRNYRQFFVIEDGYCKLLAKPENNKALYSYYAQKGDEEPYKLHVVGVLLGAKFKKRSKKFFADCKPALDYFLANKKRSSLKKVVEIYNANCVK